MMNKKNVLSLPPLVAPHKCALLPLQSESKFDPFLTKLSKDLKALNLSHLKDVSAVTIGKKYARMDELGVPFAVTVDYDTLTDNCVTLRERDSTNQIRIPIDKVPSTLLSFVTQSLTWSTLLLSYPLLPSSSSN